MKESTQELTNKYILEHYDIKSCLKKGLINYSSLARHIAKEMKIEKSTSMEAILVSSRRLQKKLEGEVSHEKKIREVLSASELEMKTKIVAFVLGKDIPMTGVTKIQEQVKKDKGTFYLVEGSAHYTIITQERHASLVEKQFSTHVQKKNTNLALVNLKSPRDIEKTVGVVSYVSALFAENNVNIVECLSCWTDSLFVVDGKDVAKVMEFLSF